MKICYIVSEIFAYGQYGGFGKLVRDIGTGLVAKGVDVEFLTWRRENQPSVEDIDGIKVFSYPYKSISGDVGTAMLTKLLHLFQYAGSLPIFKLTDADVFVSIDAQLTSFLAQRTMPNKKHVIFFQDPYDEVAFKEMTLVDKD